MTAAIALLVGALTVGFILPGLLQKLDVGKFDPLVLVIGWLLSIVGVLVATALGIALLLLPSHGVGTGALSAVHGCWSAVSHGAAPRVEEITGMLGTILLLVLTLRFALIMVRGVRCRAVLRREHLALLRIAARCEGDSPRTWWLDHDQPLAFSPAGRPGVVVATEGLIRHLSAAEVTAVLAHERAHLRGRHHLLIACADALAAALPFVPLFRHAALATRELVEVAADIAAIRECGVDTVRAALTGVANHEAPGGALAMARDAVDVRLARMAHGTIPAGNIKRAFSCGLTATTALALPVVTGAVLLLVVTMLACPLSSL
jgi:Zn-dependent protease with chaperone function